MPYGEKYPDANFERKRYLDLRTPLKSCRDVISGKIKAAKTPPLRPPKSQDADGEYYDIYLNRRDAWIDSHEQMIRVFEKFLPELDACILKAAELEALWQGRVGMME